MYALISLFYSLFLSRRWENSHASAGHIDAEFLAGIPEQFEFRRENQQRYPAIDEKADQEEFVICFVKGMNIKKDLCFV